MSELTPWLLVALLIVVVAFQTVVNANRFHEIVDRQDNIMALIKENSRINGEIYELWWKYTYDPARNAGEK